MWSLRGTACLCFYHAHVSVDVEDAFVGALLIQFGQHKLLHTKHNAIFTANRNGRAAHKHTHTHSELQSAAVVPLGDSLLIDHMTPFTAHLLFSTAFMAYSTWNTLPSGEKVEADRSYCRTRTHKHIHRQNVRRTWVQRKRVCRPLVSWQAQTEFKSLSLCTVLFVPLLTQFWTVDPN